MNFNLSLMDGSLSGGGVIPPWAGDLINDATFKVARNSTLPINALTTLDVQIDIIKTGDATPMGVYFNALTLSTFEGIARPKHELSFHWDFGDAGSTFMNQDVGFPFANDANYAMSPIAAHVFENAGTYTVRVWVYHHPTGRFGFASIDVIVIDGDIYYSGASTLVYSPTSNWTGAPAGSVQYTDYTTALNTLKANADTRLLFDRGGETLDVGTFDFRDDSMGGGRQIGLYGAGADHKVAPALIGDETQAIFKVRTPGFVIWGLTFAGDYDSITGTGENHRRTAVSTSYLLGRFLMWRTTHTGMNGNSFDSNSATVDQGGTLIIDNDITNWSDLPVICSTVRTAVVGNNIKQQVGTKSGYGGKKSSVQSLGIKIDGDGSTLVHSDLYLDIDTDINNLVVFDYNSVDGTTTELIEGTDFNFTMGTDATTNGSGSAWTAAGTHVIALVTAIDSAATDGSSELHQLYFYTRRRADHSAIRMAVSDQSVISGNDALSLNGWSGAGTYIQPPIRNHSDGTMYAHSAGTEGLCFINMNKVEGGGTQIHNGPSDSVRATTDSDCIIEQNYCIADNNTTHNIQVFFGGTTVRNNVGIRGNFPNADHLTIYNLLEGMVHVGHWVNASAANVAQPVNVFNNTGISLQTLANGMTSEYQSTHQITGTAPFDDFNEGNNLIFAPNNPTGTTTEYAPVDSGTGEINTGSSAEDTGVLDKAIVWDDLAGVTLGADASIGAFDDTVAPPVTAQELTLNRATSGYLQTPTIYAVTGDILRFKFKISAGGVWQYLQSGSGSNTRVQMSSTNKFYIDTGGATYTVDGNVIVSASTDAVPYQDGLEHTIEMTVTAATARFSMFGTNVFSPGSETFGGSIYDIEYISGPAGVNLLTKWNIDSGSITTETPSIDENGIGDIVLDGVFAIDWT